MHLHRGGVLIAFKMLQGALCPSARRAISAKAECKCAYFHLGTPRDWRSGWPVGRRLVSSANNVLCTRPEEVGCSRSSPLRETHVICTRVWQLSVTDNDRRATIQLNEPKERAHMLQTRRVDVLREGCPPDLVNKGARPPYIARILVRFLPPLPPLVRPTSTQVPRQCAWR